MKSLDFHNRMVADLRKTADLNSCLKRQDFNDVLPFRQLLCTVLYPYKVGLTSTQSLTLSQTLSI